MLFARISTGIVLFPSHIGGEKSTQTGNEDISAEISDERFLELSRTLARIIYFFVVTHYKLAAGLCKHVFFKIVYLVNLHIYSRHIP